jgi:RimJ/RimL family protein N-acetyltransferase
MIRTELLLLRDWTDADRGPFAAINADPRVTEFLPPQDRAESDAGIDRQMALAAAGEPCFLAAERISDAAFLGFIGVKPVTFAAPFSGYEIGWRLGAAFWGHGYASEGARAALDQAFHVLGLAEVFAITVPANLRSQAVMLRIGMERVEGGDFDHPALAVGDPLRRHVLFRVSRPAAAG